MDLVRVVDDVVGNLAAMFDKGIRVEEGIDVDIVSYTSNAVANTEDTVSHGLKRVPLGFIVVSQDKAGVCYWSGTTHTSTNLYLKNNVATVATKLIVF